MEQEGPDAGPLLFFTIAMIILMGMFSCRVLNDMEKMSNHQATQTSQPSSQPVTQVH